MGIKQIFKRETVYSREVIDESASATQSPAATGGSYKENITYVTSPDTAMKIATVYRAVNLISSSVAVLRLKYMRYNRIKKYYLVDDTPAGRRLNYLLSIRPNKRQNAYTFYKYLVSNILLWGNAFVLPVRDVYMNVEELILLDPRYVTLDTINNIYQVSDFVNGIYGSFDAEEILHFKNYCSDNGYWGISTIRYAAVTLGIAATAENETLKRFATGGRFKAVLQNNFTSCGVGEYQDEQLQGHADDLQTAIKRGDDLLVVKGDGKLTPISMSSADMQFLESRKLTNRDIARFFNVHQSKLMDDTNSNYKSTEMSNIAFYSETLQPYTSEIEREFCAKLLTEAAYSDHKFVVDTAPIYALDLEAKIKKMEALLRTGQSTVNELRRDNDMEPVENGDVVYLSVNLAPLGSDKLNGSSKPEDGGEDVEALKARIKELKNQLNS